MTPTPNPNWPRLSKDLPYQKGALCCGNCARSKDELPVNKTLDVWEECDHHDKREGIYIRLCEPCSKRLIEPHPRLYHHKQQHEPMPGAMPTCADCKLRDGLKCTSPLLKRNGGQGLPLSIPKPVNAMVDGSKYSGPMVLYMGPVTCNAKEPCAT